MGVGVVVRHGASQMITQVCGLCVIAVILRSFGQILSPLVVVFTPLLSLGQSSGVHGA